TQRGGTPATSDRLPTHNILYSLGNLLGGGTPSYWFGGYDVQRELAQEYRKAAEQAVRAGDYRPAAVLYGQLLGGYPAAATALSQGGLHRDAAILYLEKVGDPVAAARAFEAAGEIDRALELYRNRGEYEQAGDLLRRAGEEEAAVQEYVRAADQLIDKRND